MVTTAIESILFASGKPIKRSVIRKHLGVSSGVMEEAVNDIRRRFNVETSGIHLLEQEGLLQFVTNPKQAEVVSDLLKKEVSGELTRPQVETLTIIAYRGPITKPEIEQIRGVNCTLILRNLLMRGLVEEVVDVERLQPVYTVSLEFLRLLGVHQVEDLPKYQTYHENEQITEMLKELSESEEV